MSRSQSRAHRELIGSQGSSSSARRRRGGSLTAASASATEGWVGTNRGTALACSSDATGSHPETSNSGMPGQEDTRIHTVGNTDSEVTNSASTPSRSTTSARGTSAASFSSASRSCGYVDTSSRPTGLTTSAPSST